MDDCLLFPTEQGVPLLASCEGGHEKIVELLLSTGQVNVNRQEGPVRLVLISDPNFNCNHGNMGFISHYNIGELGNINLLSS